MKLSDEDKAKLEEIIGIRVCDDPDCPICDANTPDHLVMTEGLHLVAPLGEF